METLQDDRELLELPEKNMGLDVYDPTDKQGKKDPIKIVLNPPLWKIRISERRKNRVNITIKLDKEQTLAYRNFVDTLRPEAMPELEFAKAMFLTGIATTNQRAAEAIRDYALEHKEELASSGIEVDTDSEIPVIKSFGTLSEGASQDGTEKSEEV